MTTVQNRIDMAIEPKSDQINFDDFLIKTKNITVTNVTSTGNNDDQQPISVHFEGDNGKPYKPCKSMRRVMVWVWGDDPKKYKGKTMTLYGDHDVIWGGKKVGGIRISHMSHMDKETMVPLSASKTKRLLYRVEPFKVDNNSFEEDDYPELYIRAQAQAGQGLATYQNFFMSLTDDDKSRLIDKNDHHGFKTMAKDIDSDKSAQSDFPGDDNYIPE